MSMPRAKARRIIREFEKAVRDDAFRGAMHPDDREDIHKRYIVMKERILIALMEYTAQ